MSSTTSDCSNLTSSDENWTRATHRHRRASGTVDIDGKTMSYATIVVETKKLLKRDSHDASIIKNLPVPFVATDKNMRIVSSSREWDRVWGDRATHPHGMSLRKLVKYLGLGDRPALSKRELKQLLRASPRKSVNIVEVVEGHDRGTLIWRLRRAKYGLIFVCEPLGQISAMI